MNKHITKALDKIRIGNIPILELLEPKQNMIMRERRPLDLLLSNEHIKLAELVLELNEAVFGAICNNSCLNSFHDVVSGFLGLSILFTQSLEHIVYRLLFLDLHHTIRNIFHHLCIEHLFDGMVYHKLLKIIFSECAQLAFAALAFPGGAFVIRVSLACLSVSTLTHHHIPTLSTLNFKRKEVFLGCLV